jgi:hypothetical protein
VAYTAATTHQDWVNLTEEEGHDEERWLIDAAATVNVTASDEGMKNTTKSKR